jgi:hypothetical protein
VLYGMLTASENTRSRARANPELIDPLPTPQPKSHFEHSNLNHSEASAENLRQNGPELHLAKIKLAK